MGDDIQSREFHTQVQPPARNHYSTDILRQLADSWEKWGSGLVTFHGQTGNIMFIGANTENTQHFFDEINDYGFDLGGGSVRAHGAIVRGRRALRAILLSQYKIHRALVNSFTDEIPALPYKFKFKISGCPNDYELDRTCRLRSDWYVERRQGRPGNREVLRGRHVLHR